MYLKSGKEWNQIILTYISNLKWQVLEHLGCKGRGFEPQQDPLWAGHRNWTGYWTILDCSYSIKAKIRILKAQKIKSNLLVNNIYFLQCCLFG